MKYKITLEGRTYEVVVEEGQATVVDEYEARIPAPAAAPAPTPAAVAAAVPTPAAPVSEGTKVPSPLPGNILSIKVNVGDAVKAGDVLLIIEAMKMENEVVAPCDGMVKQIVTSKGAVVSSGDMLMVI